MTEPLVIIDFVERELTVLGERLIVAVAMSDELCAPHEPNCFAHFSVPAGENGWWVDFGFCLTDTDLYTNLCGEPWSGWGGEPDDILIALLEAGAKTEPPKLDEDDDMCGGLQPGTWHDMYRCWPERWEWPGG